MVEALTFIVHKDPETDMLVTVFEEDQTADPATSCTHFQQKLRLCSLEALPVHIRKLIIVSQKQAMPLMQVSYIISIPLLLTANLRLNIHNECYCYNLYGGYYGD